MEARGVMDQKARGGDVGRHVGEHELDRLEADDRLAELFAVTSVGGGVLERSLSHAERHRGHHQPAEVEVAHGHLERLVLRPHQAVGRQAHVGERDLTVFKAMHAEKLLVLAARDAG
ncbi:hypothetical protein ACVWXO_007071 [Bradyrhizobium sp. LM2.7]